MKTWILDDDINSIAAIKAALSSYPQIEIVHTFTSGKEFKEQLQQQECEVLFLDIELDNEHGFEIARYLEENYQQVRLVFVTGYSSYAIDGYDFHPVSFLTKPLDSKKVEKCVQLLEKSFQNNNDDYLKAKIAFKTMNSFLMFKVSDILYVERNNRKNYVVTTRGTNRIGNYTIKNLEIMLEKYGFYCCHQSFVINVNRIKAIEVCGIAVYEAVMDYQDLKVPVSRNHYDELKQLLAQLTTNQTQ